MPPRENMITRPFIYKPTIGARFITFTLKPKWYKKELLYQFKTFSTLLDIISKLYTCEGSITTELTEQGNIHYHIWILCSVATDYYRLVDAWRIIGSTFITKEYIKCESSQLRTLTYMRKQHETVSTLLPNMVIALTFQVVKKYESLPITSNEDVLALDSVVNKDEENPDEYYFKINSLNSAK